jgi:hypothetical protein
LATQEAEIFGDTECKGWEYLSRSVIDLQEMDYLSCFPLLLVVSGASRVLAEQRLFLPDGLCMSATMAM